MEYVYESKKVRVSYNQVTGSYYCDYRIKLFGIFPQWEKVLAKFSDQEDAVTEGGRCWFVHNVMKKRCSSTIFNGRDIRVHRQGATYRAQRKSLGFLWLNVSNEIYDNENDAMNEAYRYADVHPSRVQEKYIRDAEKTLAKEFEKTKTEILNDAVAGIGGAYEIGAKRMAE